MTEVHALVMQSVMTACFTNVVDSVAHKRNLCLLKVRKDRQFTGLCHTASEIIVGCDFFSVWIQQTVTFARRC